MYCPRCEKAIPRERMEAIRKELSERFGKDDLDQGICPVCGTRMVPLPKRGD